MRLNYYSLVAGLQDLALDINKLSVEQIAFREELEVEVHPGDFNLVKKIFLPFDNKNLLNLLQKNEEPFDERGNFSQSELEENIKIPGDELPSYMKLFIENFNANESLVPDMSPENQLTTVFYDYTRGLNNEFVKNWFSFFQTLNNLITAMTCRKYNLPYENQIIGSDETSDIIRKSHARDFGLSAEVPYMEDLLNIFKNDDLQEREKAIDQIKWDYLEDTTFFYYFTIERILAFCLKLEMVERWLKLDVEHGHKMFRELLDELKSSYKLPETFTEK